MTDIMKIALAKRERLMADLEQLNEFIRMAERLVREDTDADMAKPTPGTGSVEAPKEDAVHRSLSSMLRDVESKQAEPAPEGNRRSGLWRATPAVAARG